MLRIIQLSDCHLPGDRAASYRGRDPYAAVEALLGPINAWAPDLLLATGDLSEDASARLRWLAGQLEKLAKPVLAIPGNHDRCRSHARVFRRTSRCMHRWCMTAGAGDLIMLDSAPAGQIAGQFE